MPSRPIYPEVQNIKDRPSQQSIKALWDRAYSATNDITTLQTQIAALQSTISSLQSTIASLERKVNTISSPASE